MKRYWLTFAGLAGLGAAAVASPEAARAGAISISFGHGGYYGYGYRPIHYGYYHRPYVRKVVIVHRPYYPAYYYRPYVRRIVYRYPWHERRRCWLPERYLCG